MSDIKICHLTSVHPVTDTRIFIKECSSLAKAGYATNLVVAGAEDQYKNSIYIHGVKKENNSRLLRMLKTTRAVYKKALEVDAHIYHFHDPELIPIGLLLKRKGKKVIYDVHEDVPEQVLSKEWIPFFIRRPISVLVKLLEKYSAKRFDGIVTATKFIENRFKIYNHNSIAIQNFPLKDELYNHNYESKKNIINNYITYIGGITKIRGIKEIVIALEKINKVMPVTLLLGGKFENDEFKKEVKRQPGWKCVEYLGWIDRKKMNEILSKSKCGIVLFHPELNHINAQPNKMFEYMSAGVPVLASDFPLWKEIVEGNQCGLTTNPLDTDEIAKSIVNLVKDNQKVIELGKNGRKAVEDKFNWDIEEKKLLDLYQQLCKDR